MSNHHTKSWRCLPQLLIAITVTFFGLTSCGGGSDSSGGGGGGSGAPPPSTCSTTGSASAITLSNLPARTSGVAPLSVFFDASGTTATTTTRPFHDLEYRWDFGDPSGSPVSGTNWTNGSSNGSRNTATGPVSAHVFETPGTYNVTLAVTDCVSNVATSSTQIVVQDPDTVFAGNKTVCVATSSTPVAGTGGCPTGATVVLQSSFASAVNTHALADRRVLFKRGDTFLSSGTAILNKTGPGIIGAYGPGGTAANPVVQISVNASILQVSSGSTSSIKDWRVMDLVFDGQNKTIQGVDAAGKIDQLTFLRLKIQNLNEGFTFSEYTAAGGNFTLWDQLTIADTSVLHMVGANGGNGSYIASQRFAFMGNMYNDSAGAEHILRLPQVYRGVLGNNSLSRPASGKHVLKLHGPTWSGGNPPAKLLGANGYSEWIVVSDNQFINGSPTRAVDWTVSIGPQNDTSDERVRNAVFERNWFDGTNSNQQVALLLHATEITARNNIFNLTGALYHTGIEVSRRGVEPAPSNVRLYNNTIYSGSTGDFEAIRISNATNTTVRNNLGSAPSASGPVMISGAGTGVAQSNNIMNTSPAAVFVSSTPTIPANFMLKALPNAARDTGLNSVLVFSDYFRTDRPQGSSIDVGAAEGL